MMDTNTSGRAHTSILFCIRELNHEKGEVEDLSLCLYWDPWWPHYGGGQQNQ